MLDWNVKISNLVIKLKSLVQYLFKLVKSLNDVKLLLQFFMVI